MGEAKFTPGPWGVTDFGRRPIMVSAGSIHGWRGMIATADAGDYARSVEEGQANAALIAAAPDLYAALENIAWATPEKTAFSAEELIEVLRATARAALAKASPTPVVAATDNEGGER